MYNHTYIKIPDKVIKPTLEWKQTVEDSVAKHGVMWITPRYVGDNPDFPVRQNQQRTAAKIYGAEPKRRRREIPYVWYVDYKCHRSGNYRDKVSEGSRVRGGSTGSIRYLQKSSKKMDCKAKLKITCFKQNPKFVKIIHIGVHNHEVGSIHDIKHLPLSLERKNQITERLHTVDEIAELLFKKIFANSAEIFCYYPTIRLRQFIEIKSKAVDEQESISLWLDELRQKNYCTFKHSTFVNDFTFGFSSPWQKELLKNATAICLDATHCVSHIQRGILYTIVIRHAITGTGCPVAYMFTKDHSMASIAAFLSFVKHDIGAVSLEKITIDISATEHAAINAVYPEATIQWCLFHVSRAWMEKIRELVKLGSSALNNQIHKDIIADLKALMWERNPEVFLLNLLGFRTYLNVEKFVHWSTAFQPQVYTNMETNNFIESWHNQLKTTYMGRKRNRRVDRLIFILVNDVEPDYIHNICRISLNIGRMGPEERKRRRREMDAAGINEAVLSIMIEEPDKESNVYRVKSFTDELLFYDIDVIDREMRTCSCSEFQWHEIACKHMYLLRRLHPDIVIYNGVPIFVQMPSYAKEVQTLSDNANTVTALSVENRALNIINNLETTLNQLKHNTKQLTNEQILQLAESTTNIINILQISSSIGSNSNFVRQRR
ncbi:hypothetical protein [Parasitella parasitica]|uniref:SWIM-type domain-containing protein n=1 Tax=Parasitella parasitica TaxID=35722 RepID=A0A0B7NDF9_9FUNG|nr:hypothetical protein [Parasitella parasitica]